MQAAKWGKWGLWKTTGMLLVAKNTWCFCTRVSNRGRKFVEVCHMFMPSLAIHWRVPYRRPNLPSNLWNNTLLLLHSLATFSYVFLWAPFGTTTWMLVVFNWFISMSESRTHSNFWTPHGIVTESCFEHLLHSHSSSFEAKLNRNMFQHLKVVNCK
jgi:hypothetical protein